MIINKRDLEVKLLLLFNVLTELLFLFGAEPPCILAAEDILLHVYVFLCGLVFQQEVLVIWNTPICIIIRFSANKALSCSSVEPNLFILIQSLSSIEPFLHHGSLCIFLPSDNPHWVD